MTRWAKAGSSQKHKKLPEDSTPWQELSKNIKKIKNINKTQNDDSESFKSVNKSIHEQSGNKNSSAVDALKLLPKEPKIRKKKKRKNNLDVCDGEESKMPKDSPKIEHLRNMTPENFKLCTDEKQGYKEQSENKVSSIKDETSFKTTKEPKLKKRKRQKDSLNEGNLDLYTKEESNKDIVQELDSLLYTEDEVNEGNNIKNSSKKQKKNFISPKLESRKNFDEMNQSLADTDLQKHSNGNKKSSSEGQRLSKKEIFRIKLKERRKKLGIMLLPQNVENRLYRIKRRLREKGFPPEKIKEIIREERKKAQNEYRKTIVTKICFNCRKPGHVLADCPNLSKLDNQETGICFKCGSTEHISAKCKRKVSGFPFASCFICKNQGHISRDCPDNKHGIYPKGGKCNLCDSINHLRKDCPLLKKKSEEETTIQLHTIDEGKSIDDEIMDVQDSKKKQKFKKHKIVAF